MLHTVDNSPAAAAAAVSSIAAASSSSLADSRLSGGRCSAPVPAANRACSAAALLLELLALLPADGDACCKWCDDRRCTGVDVDDDSRLNGDVDDRR